MSRVGEYCLMALNIAGVLMFHREFPHWAMFCACGVGCSIGRFAYEKETT